MAKTQDGFRLEDVIRGIKECFENIYIGHSEGASHKYLLRLNGLQRRVPLAKSTNVRQHIVPRIREALNYALGRNEIYALLTQYK